MKSTSPEALSPSWKDLVLVCRDCRKRSRGPKAKAKEVASELKKQFGHAKPRPRVVMTTCMGLCPTKATAVALVREGQPIAAIAVASIDQIADIGFDSRDDALRR
jgi:predicted metal-binding protein